MTRVLAFHKPRGLVTTHHDEHGRETVYDRLKASLPRELAGIRWHAIGRLDKDTSGLLLFTDDGALVHFATQPASGLTKTYRVLAKGLLTDGDLDRLRAGVELSGGLGRSAPAKVRLLAHQIATSWIEIELSEGKNREVRRMLLAIDSQAIRLERVRVGRLELDLEPERWRLLSDKEIAEGLGYTPEPSSPDRSDRGAARRTRIGARGSRRSGGGRKNRGA